MLKIQEISKEYRTGELVQRALAGVSLNLRDSEFVSILGPSGSGKTTLLNVIGGLDRYDSGDLVINGVSTKKYGDRQWDAYRNHSIGFVFQSYNLIPHQSVLANVELALTIGGVRKSERRARAKRALDEVGLGDQGHKRPAQMSGGQMQRVAIARALVNNPDIVLADEPTGALDSETSIQVMELLKKVAQTRLVVMVTHNPELAERYSTRIVKLRDGAVISDSAPFSPESIDRMYTQTLPTTSDDEVPEDQNQQAQGITLPRVNPIAAEPRKMDASAALPQRGKHHAPVRLASAPTPAPAPTSQAPAAKRSTQRHTAKMGFGTSLALSFNNLRTKKARTILTAFAGSIGIIGIALILALSAGVNTYITDTQRETMTSYPITIESQAFNMASMESFSADEQQKKNSETDAPATEVTADTTTLEAQQAMQNSVSENDLTAFKKYLDNPDSEIHQYVGENGISYSYATKFSVFGKNSEGKLVDTDGEKTAFTGYSTQQNSASAMNNMSVWMGTSQQATGTRFSQVMAPPSGAGVNESIKSSYRLVDGEWAEGADDVMLVLLPDGTVDATALHDLGLLPDQQYDALTSAIEDEKKPEPLTINFSSVIGHEYFVVPVSSLYEKNDAGNYTNSIETMSADELESRALPVRVAGIIQAKDTDSATILTPVVYTKALTDQIVAATNDSAVVKAQEAQPDKSVLSGQEFTSEESTDSGSGSDAAGASTTESGVEDVSQAGAAAGSDTPAGLSSDPMAAFGTGGMMGASALPQAHAAALPTTYDETLKALGKVDYNAPSSIDIYVDSFDAKEGISDAIAAYNAKAPKAEQITYTDFVALLTSSITSIINAISYVLIAFVAVSLIVSCIMIGIITHISVLERTKEIGILRALGASKRNVSQVFNAETVIIGLCSGLLGVGISMLLTFPINAVIQELTNNDSIRAAVPPVAAVILVGISIVITLIGGLLPARSAAKKDPVIALRSE